jgi:hypothetical protein
VKNTDPSTTAISLPELSGPGRKTYDEHVVLDLDYWALIPRKPDLPKAA